MAPLLTIEIDTAALLQELGQFADAAEKHLKAAAKVTADNIVREARGRVARRTGETASHIVAEESRDKHGYIVWVQPDVKLSLHTSRSGRTHTQRVTYNALGGWLEHGTKYMTARPFLFVSARLEESSHTRRIQEALVAALADTGLGE